MRRRIERNPVNVVSGVLALIFLFAGIAKLIGADVVIERFQAWGYPVVLVPLIGLVEVLGALALLVPSVASLGALGLAVVMMCAIGTHLLYGFAPYAVLPLALLVALVWLARRRLEEPLRWTLSWRRDLG